MSLFCFSYPHEDKHMNSKITGIALATVVAGLFSVASVNKAFAADDAKVKCEHSTSCKGQSACKNSANSCKGQNACKGQGMTEQKDAATCTAAEAAAKKS